MDESSHQPSADTPGLNSSPTPQDQPVASAQPSLSPPQVAEVSQPSLSPEPAARVPTPGIYPSPVHGVTADFSPPAPMPPASPEDGLDDKGVVPQPVVHVLSPRGVEYVFLTISLFTAAIGLTSILLSLVNGKTDFAVLSFPVAALLVSVPVFAWLFLRLKRAELQNPSLSLDASKRRSTQFTQIVSFLVVLFTMIGFFTAIFAKLGGQYDGSMVKLVLDVIVILAVSGGILAYYWTDEHKK